MDATGKTFCVDRLWLSGLYRFPHGYLISPFVCWQARILLKPDRLPLSNFAIISCYFLSAYYIQVIVLYAVGNGADALKRKMH